eukprot:6096568-Pyramimonas_sp.AAC.2
MRSNRPGLLSAASRVSGRLVAARQMTVPACVSKPSSSVSSWFNVCSRSSLPTGRSLPSPRPLATASISSINTIDGACSAVWHAFKVGKRVGWENGRVFYDVLSVAYYATNLYWPTLHAFNLRLPRPPGPWLWRTPPLRAPCLRLAEP